MSPLTESEIQEALADTQGYDGTTAWRGVLTLFRELLRRTETQTVSAQTCERNLEEKPYSPDEARVAKWFSDTAGIGGGDDPIGALIASHEYVVAERNRLREEGQS